MNLSILSNLQITISKFLSFGDRQKEVDGMNDHGDISQVRHSEDPVIRLEKEDEYREVENLVRNSFWNVYRPGCLEHYVLNQLRNDSAFVPELDFVMLLNGEIIGQNMFMRAEITADDGRSIRVMTMGPICIKNELKRKGYGKILLDYSLQKVAELGCGRIRQAVSI